MRVLKQTKRAKSRQQFLHLKTACFKISKRREKKNKDRKKGQGRQILGKKNNNEIYSHRSRKDYHGLMGLGIRDQVAGPWAAFVPRLISSKVNDDLC